MSIKEVKRTETAKLLHDFSEDSDLIYEAKIAGLKCTIHYSFTDNMLTGAGYFLREKYSNDNLYIADYHKVTRLLNKKYYKSEEERIWTNPTSLYKELRHQDDGMAIAKGDLALMNEWDTTRTTIKAAITGNQYRITTTVIYESKIHTGRVDKKSEEEDLADF